MTTPTREQVIEWAREANFDVSTLNSIDGDEVQCDSCKVILTDQLERFATLAMAAGRDQGLREAKEVCEDMMCSSDKCAAAIEQLRTKQ